MRYNLLFYAASALVPLIHAQKPESTVTLRDSPPSQLLYFDDSSNVLYHDSANRNVFRSEDEGKTWSLIQGVPEGDAFQVIEHPFSTATAFILTKSKTQYRSTNRGQSWQSFETPYEPTFSQNALSFHAKEWDWIIFTGSNCQSDGGFSLPWQGSKACVDEAFYTLDGFQSAPIKLLDHTSRCSWAHATKEFAGKDSKQVLCIAFEAPAAAQALEHAGTVGHTVESVKAWFAASRSLRESRLYSSTDFFKADKRYVDLGIGKEARGIVGLGNTQGFIVAALKPTSDAYPSGTSDEMELYVTRDGTAWQRGIFPHGQPLKENAYTIVDATSYKVFIDVLTDPTSNSGTLFTSNSEGTFFIRSLEHTNRNMNGIVDFERLENVDGVAIANILTNFEDVSSGRGSDSRRIVQTRITFNDGAKWQSLKAPSKDAAGKDVDCDVSDTVTCGLHLHSVTQPHNLGSVFSSTAPGLVMAVGSIGSSLKAYEDCDTFLSTDAGLTWRMVRSGANMYEFGDQGSLLVLVDDEEPTDNVQYSTDFGKTWQVHQLGVQLRVKALTTIPDSTSLKFLLTGSLSKNSQGDSGERHAIVFVDFAQLNKRKCGDNDFEKWYARSADGQDDCLLGHKDWFRRRKADADCFVGDKFTDPVGREEDCACTDRDYECDFNYWPDPVSGECVLSGPQQIPPGQCLKAGDTFLGSSGYRKVPGNTCKPSNNAKDAPRQKPCSEGEAAPGQISHQRYDFPALILDQSYFADSHTIIAHLSDLSMYQSDNEGFTWSKIDIREEVLGFSVHPHDKQKAYVISKGRKVTWTPDAGATWKSFSGPTDQNGLGLPLLHFHPTRPEWLIWSGSVDCESTSTSTCRGVAHYSTDDGRNWKHISDYVRQCAWGRDVKFKIEERTIVCEAYRDQKGNQRDPVENPVQFVYGENFYSKKNTIFDSGVVGFATFEEYMVIALMQSSGSLRLMVSLDGRNFAQAMFPPGMRLENMAYTVLESTTASIFLHVSTQPKVDSAWGILFKSNSNGTNFAESLQYANRDNRGYVDFEKMIGLDGIAIMNIVSNPDEALSSSVKKLQTRITHNDGGRWKAISPPTKDSLGNTYPCTSTSCGLHLHGYTERIDPRATYSSPSAVGLMMAVGNVGMTLAPYEDSDTFLTRDGGFTWEEVHKDAHLWEFGDQGSILILANDEAPTDRITYSLNEGLTWQDYNFGEAIKIRSILTVPVDTSRKFILLGYSPRTQQQSVAVHLDFSRVTNVKCKFDVANPNNDDFEVWSPSEQRESKCLFGRQTFYHRRIRDRNCYIGEKLPQPFKDERNCECTADDFECEFNHIRNPQGVCVLADGAEALASDPTCSWEQEYWYDRTAYRKIPHSSCVDGLTLDRGTAHLCPHRYRHGFFWWTSVLISPFLLAGLFALWWLRRRSQPRRGRIHLADPENAENGPSTALDNLASIPFFVVGVISSVVAWVGARLPTSRAKSGYRSLALDDDAALLGPEDPDD